MVYVIVKNLKIVDVVVGKFTNCGCIELDFRLKEFEIPKFPKPNKPNIQLSIPDDTDIQELKDKVICEYNRIIQQLGGGIQPDLEFL